MARKTPPTAEEVVESLRIWEEESAYPDLWVIWNDLWQTTPPALLDYVARRRGDLEEVVTKRLNLACDNLDHPETFQAAIRNIFDEEDSLPEATAEAIRHRARSLCHAVRAAFLLRGWVPQTLPSLTGQVSKDLLITFESTHASWQLASPPVNSLRKSIIAEPSEDRATAIVDEFIQPYLATQPRPDWLTEANWLIVRRLLSYLLEGDSIPPLPKPFSNQLNLLLAEGPDREGVFKGHVFPTTMTLLKEGHAALYPDPVTCGLMVIDDDMRSSLHIADQLLRPILGKEDHHRLTGLRWEMAAPDVGLPRLLTGDSASGLILAAAVATARRTELDSDATASFALRWPEGTTPTTDLDPATLQIAPVGPASIIAKLTQKLPTLRERGIERVFLCGTQTADPGNRDWNSWTKDVAEQTKLTIIPVGPASPPEEQSTPKTTTATLAQFIDAMTGNAKMERILDAYCDHLHSRWAKAKPKAFVEFRFGRLPDKDDPTDTDERLAGRVGDKKTDETSLYKPVTDKKDATAEDHLRELLALGRKVCLTEDAGAGKTIASHRLLHYLTNRTRLNDENLRSPLVARFESREHNWPNDVRHTLIDDIALSGVVPSVNDSDRNWIAKVVDYAIRNKRLTLIFDAFDQVYDGPRADRNRSELLQSIWAFYQTNDCQVIVTSRAFAVRPETSTTFFPRDEWKFATIFGFHEAEQTDYLRQAGKLNANQQVAHLFAPVDGGRSENLYQRDPEIRRLLSVPNNLNLLRDLSDEEIRKIRNRFDLYQKFHNQQLNRATRDGSQLDSKKCHVMLAAAGFQMMLDGCWNYSLLDDDAQTLELRVDQRCRQQGYPTSTADWDNLKKWSELTNHGILDDIASHGTRPSISWKHRGWMEFFAARYLTLFASPEEAEEALPNNGEPNWYWTWRFVLEAPLAECIDDRWQSAVTLLFSPVPDKHKPEVNPQTKRPEKKLILRPRPTELMFRAWQVMERGWQDTGQPREAELMWNVRDTVLLSYRRQFLEILTGQDQNRAERAAELITRDDFDKHMKSLSPSYSPLPPGEGPGAARPNTTAPDPAWVERMRQMYADCPTYELCSNATSKSSLAKPSTDTQHLTFRMGASPEDSSAYEDEKYDASDKKTWWIEQEIPAFQMAMCCVTRAQYRLFDPHREQDKLQGEYGISKRSPDEDCPITHVDWWDAFCFALWLGEEYQLPTELQWEGAAWGGIDRASRREAVISVPPYHAGFTSNEVNHDGSRPIEGQQPSDESQRTLPVRWDKLRRQEPLLAPVPKPLPRAYQANGFGLWHMNGNVWEWCQSGWEETLQGAIERAKADITKEEVNAGTGRVVRGGSWLYYARYTRSSYRYGSLAERRSNDTGFRLSRTRSN